MSTSHLSDPHARAIRSSEDLTEACRHARLSTLACWIERIPSDDDAARVVTLLGSMPVREGSALALALDGAL